MCVLLMSKLLLRSMALRKSLQKFVNLHQCLLCFVKKFTSLQVCVKSEITLKIVNPIFEFFARNCKCSTLVRLVSLVKITLMKVLFVFEIDCGASSLVAIELLRTLLKASLICSFALEQSCRRQFVCCR